MESAHSLETLNRLEKKIGLLIEMVIHEKNANKQLIEENKSLAARLESLENSLMKESKTMEELNQERQLTRMAVDELIQSIDRLVEEQQTASL
jgi:hypothetical protein